MTTVQTDNRKVAVRLMHNFIDALISDDQTTAKSRAKSVVERVVWDNGLAEMDEGTYETRLIATAALAMYHQIEFGDAQSA